jgi:tetratricopeptide (TPR) repeat protein
LRDRFADSAAAEPEVLVHHFTQAAMTDAAIEWWGKAGDQALRRSAFQEAIAHLGKAIEMADQGEGTPRAGSQPTAPDRRLRLQTSYGQALTWGKGYAAPETAAAFARAQELAANINNAIERFATYYGQWAGSYMRGEYALARETARAFLRDADDGSLTPQAAAARRVLGLTCHSQGDFTDARDTLHPPRHLCGRSCLRRSAPLRQRKNGKAT